MWNLLHNPSTHLFILKLTPCLINLYPASAVSLCFINKLKLEKLTYQRFQAKITLPMHLKFQTV